MLGKGESLQDVAEGEPVGDVEEDEGAGEHNPWHPVLRHKEMRTQSQAHGPATRMHEGTVQEGTHLGFQSWNI